jgi:hypothetical protein
MTTNYPPILSSFGAFHQHIEGQLKGLLGHAKGDPWQEFSKKIMPITEIGGEFQTYRDNPKKTRDKGWDIIGKDDDKKTIYVQAKYTVDNVNELDSVVSNWVPLAGINPGQLPLGLENPDVDSAKTLFALVTTSDLHSAILKRYLESQRPSARYLKDWLEEKRAAIIDGPTIYSLFREHYTKSFSKPQDHTLSFVTQHINYGNVWIGVIAASELKRIYKIARDSIFFENVRDFSGMTDVNQEIARTIRENADKFLQKNNGIVFSTSKVTKLDDHKLKLEKASIVNGCQTTLSIVNTAGNEEPYILVKIVELDKPGEGWEVTKAANFQNEIKRIDLELAMYIRPQVARRQSYMAGVPIGGTNENVLDLLDTFNQQPLTWRNIRILFIGLFSREPGNMFDVRWDLVQDKLLAYYFQSDSSIHRIFNIVFELHIAAERAAEWTREAFAEDLESVNLFSRLLGDTRAPYKQYLIILALSALVQMNIAERKETLDDEIARMDDFFDKVQRMLEVNPKLVDEAFLVAFESAAGDALEEVRSADVDEIRRKMFNRITKQAKFSSLYRKVKLGLVRH